MTIMETILSTPMDVTAGTTTEHAIDGAFSNLLNYAKRNWSYTASGSTGGDMLLAGTATSAPCGGIATALLKVFKDGLRVDDGEMDYIRVTGYLRTGPTYLCFDPKVKGNIRKLESPNVYGLGCMFNEHYYVQCKGKYYDPCMSTSYAVKDQSIAEHFPKYLNLNNRKMMISSDKKTCYLYMPSEPVPGFQGSWAMFDNTKKNLEKALGSATLKTELAALQGTTLFAAHYKAAP